jgi:hypothetical protein
MKTQQILRISVLFALTLMMIAVSSVLAFDPPTGPSGIPWPTTMPWPTARPLAVGERWSPNAPSGEPSFSVPPVSNPVTASVSVALPKQPQASQVSGGTSPFNALEPTGAWQLLDAGASVWYRVGTGGVHMDVFLDADPPDSVSMAIYAPREFGKPIGRGTPYQLDRTRLVWSGGNWRANGDWVALLTNNLPMTARYKITSSGQDISNKSCYGYWEYIGTQYVYWTICQ